MRHSVRVLCLCALGAAALLVAGCFGVLVYDRPHRYHRPGPVVVTPPGPAVVAPGPAVVAPAPGLIVVPTAPPPPRREVRPPCPVVGHIWCAGYWHWEGGRHVWIAGRWMAPPRRGAVWVVPKWDRGPRGWSYHPGHWR